MACEFHVQGGQLPQEELNNYLTRAREQYGREPQPEKKVAAKDFAEIVLSQPVQILIKAK